MLEEISDLHLYDFGIFIELMPDEEEKQMLENNIQMALQQNSVDLEDAIDVREIKSIKLANQVLKLRRKKKMQADQAASERNIQAQAEANMRTQQEAAQLEVQKESAKAQAEAQLEQIKADLDIVKLRKEAEIKKLLMEQEFMYNMRLKGVEVDGVKDREAEKENRKDQRTRIQATQQSEMIDQRNNQKPPKNFESMGNDTLTGDFDLGAFDPR
jgi:hypothetical protein